MDIDEILSSADFGHLKAAYNLIVNYKDIKERMREADRDMNSYYFELNRWLEGAIGELKTVQKEIKRLR